MAEIGDEKLRNKIKEILKGADLTTLSAKKVRIKLQASFSVDLADRKKEIDKMTMGLIMEMEEEKKKQTEEKEEEKDGEEEENNQSEDENEQTKNGKAKKTSEEEDQEEDQEEEVEEKEPPKKKAKSKESKSSSKKRSKSKKVKDLDDMAPLDNDVVQIYDEEQKTLKMSDEELAQRLQSFEDTGRRTRGKAKSSAAKFNKQTPRKKPGEKKERKGTSTYSKPCFLSADLAELMGTDKMARNEVVKKMWEIVKERKLEDPNDRRFMLCDEQLQKIFGRKRLQTFGMMKYLSSHIRDEGPSLETVITNTDIYDDEADDD